MKTIGNTLLCLLFLALLLLGGARRALAQNSTSVLYIPLIGITLVPEPLALPRGPSGVTYNYAVKSFLKEVPLEDVQVNDENCLLIKFVTGDDNNNSRLDYDETWRYRCTTKLSETTQSTAIVQGSANGITAMHKAYASVIVGSNSLPPLVSVINVTKVAYPLSLPKEGGKITFTYRVNNPGVVPLSSVSVSDDKCRALSGKLGDTNGNNLLDTNEVWTYTCTTTLTQTTTNTVKVEGFANNLKAVGEATITVRVDTPSVSPGFPNVGTSSNFKTTAWKTLVGILAVLVGLFVLKNKGQHGGYREFKPTRRRKK